MKNKQQQQNVLRKSDHLCEMLAGKDNNRKLMIAFDNTKAVL